MTTATFNVGNSHDFVLQNPMPRVEVWNPDSEELKVNLAPGGGEMVFTPPRPLMNKDTKIILNRVVAAMSRMESKNICPKTIVLPRKEYFTVLTRSDFIHDPGEQHIDPAGLKCKLFGRKLVCSESFYSDKRSVAKVLSEYEFGTEEGICMGGSPYVFIRQRGEPFWHVPANERQAMETLRDMLSEKNFRKYIKDGFIVVRGISGKHYQIFRRNSHIKVWQNGIIISEICVYIRDRIPSTDRVIAFKIMIETEEEELYRIGNVYKFLEAA